MTDRRMPGDLIPDPWVRSQLLGRWVRKERKLVAAIVASVLVAWVVAATQQGNDGIPFDTREIRDLTELPLNPNSGK